MTFLEKFEEIKGISQVDVKFDKDFAIQINLTDEDCGGAFYVEHRNGVVNVEPYDYYDRDAMMTISSDLLVKILTGKADPVTSFLAGKFAIDGSVEAALELKKIAEAVKAKKKAEEKAKKDAEKKKPEGLAVIGIEDFMKVELTAAKVINCEPIKRAKKLLKLTLDDGSGKERTVASGIAKYYKPEDLIGKGVIVVSNLKPAVLCGVESNGMILAADDGDDIKVIFVDGVTPGSRIR